MPARRLAATLALAALGSLVVAQAAMAQAGGGGGRTIDPVQAIGNTRDLIIAIGTVGFLSLMLPCIFLIWKRKYEAAIVLAAASMIPGLFLFAYFVIPAIVRGLGDRLAQ